MQPRLGCVDTAVIFVSSHRPFNNDVTMEYVRNQVAAFKSWFPIASAIVYFGAPEAQLVSSKTVFINTTERFPSLREMIDVCADQKEWSCLINADIWVSPILPKIESRLMERRAACASSWRHEFNPAIGIDPCERVDNGLDFFAATPASWSKIFDNMWETPQGMHDSPSHLKFGGPSWDSWLIGAFNKFFRHHFYNLTKYKMIRHPAHHGRQHCPGVPPVHHLGACAMAEREL